MIYEALWLSGTSERGERNSVFNSAEVKNDGAKEVGYQYRRPIEERGGDTKTEKIHQEGLKFWKRLVCLFVCLK